MAEGYIKGLLSGGEVVLVDTRQHWMAAVRFALRPILLVGAIILLAIFNAWAFGGHEGFFNTVNTILNWILLIMVIVAVIWLPINLVQWYSRKYVLTNRRAMRMSGVLRKSSFDSSLEQINDIQLEQSFIGRQLNYANLTLFTASDTANEQYEQLIDGIQFKKAVLDAKEGIRKGAPLTSLPEGFIVKGGTNEASMRADGKIQEAASLATAPEPNTLSSDAASAAPPEAESDEGEATTETTSAAVEPEPASTDAATEAPEPVEATEATEGADAAEAKDAGDKTSTS